MTQFANDFHSWLRHSWKSLANSLTRYPKIVIHGNSYIILYIWTKVGQVHWQIDASLCLNEFIPSTEFCHDQYSVLGIYSIVLSFRNFLFLQFQSCQWFKLDDIWHKHCCLHISISPPVYTILWHHRCLYCYIVMSCTETHKTISLVKKLLWGVFDNHCEICLEILFHLKSHARFSLN